MNPFLQTLRNLGPARLAAMGAVLIGLIAFFVFVAGRMSTPGMALLYSGLSNTDAAAIVQQLEGQKVPYELSSSGDAISVPGQQVAKLRMQVAAAGLPRGGSIGYEIFDQPEGFGTTSFVQSINHLRALEGELARTIGTLTPIQTARVHLVLPQRELFGRGEQKATASVFLRIRGGQALTHENVAAIQNLVAASVPALSPDQIAIVDDRGNLLAKANNGAPGSDASGQSHDEMRAAFEAAQTQKIEDILSKTLGYGKVRATVSADMDFDRITTNSESYDPDQQVVRSTQTTSEDSSTSEGGDNNTVSITNNLPNQGAAGGAGGANGNKNTRNEETTNYEIGKKITSQVKEVGTVKRMSVAVLVDGTYTPPAPLPADATDEQKKAAETAQPTYAPRSADEMKQITALVRSAVAIDDKRGDTIEVENMRFAPVDMPAESADPNQLFGFPKADIMQLAQTAIMAIVALLVVLLVVRPMLKRLFESNGPGDAPMAGDARLVSGTTIGGQAALAPPGGYSAGVSGALAQSLAGAEDQGVETLIDISRVEGRVKASAVKKVGEIIEKHPEESVSILRNWMYQESR